MASNDLFRIVSLRHSKSAGDNGADTPPDPRLRHREILEGQAATATSPREAKLRELASRHVKLSAKAGQLERVQRAVVNAYMHERKDIPVPKAKPTVPTVPDQTEASGSTTDLDASSSASGARDRFRTRVEARLSKAEIAVFRDVISGGPVDVHNDLSHLLDLFDPGHSWKDANEACTQIQAIQENVGDALPTVPVQPPGEDPIVTAVGWGDLIVARENLVGYAAREVAHIENILSGETKVREHQRLSKTEEVQETETITEKETEKDSQTTDRYELQAESQETINRDFSISTGVNTSGQYGLTQMDTSLDSAFSQSQSQSRSSSIETAREIVTKAKERTFERVRRLRRLTITEEIREFNRHKLANVAEQSTPTAISGFYMWVEKIQRVELRHYGTRMMVEFHVPEPAVSLHEHGGEAQGRKKLPPFDVAVSGVNPGNYMCLAQRYGAMDVEPPPTEFTEVGYGWVAEISDELENEGEAAFNSTINIPEDYRPIWAKVAWSALRGKPENREFNFAFSVGGNSQGIEYTVMTYDGVVLQLPAGSSWPQGVPVSGRLRGAWDGAVYVQVRLTCVRTTEALDAWRLRTWEALRVGYEALERKTAQDEQQQAYQRDLLGPVISERPAAENRRIERNELQKWSIKSMRLVPQNFNAIEQIGEFQEVSPVHAEAQAPIVRFYEDAFEWEHMTYFLYAYHWARRASWRMRSAAKAVDQQHQAFVEAGAARVIVPVTPGFEDKVAWFLDPANAKVSEIDRILTPPPTTVPQAGNDQFRDLWIELLTDRKADVARGSGTITVEKGNTEVTVNADSQWSTSDQRDLGRELYIAGDRYEVVGVANETTFSLDRPYEGASDASATYVAGSAPFGPPWTVNVPTSLVVLADNLSALEAV